MRITNVIVFLCLIRSRFVRTKSASQISHLYKLSFIARPPIRYRGRGGGPLAIGSHLTTFYITWWYNIYSYHSRARESFELLTVSRFALVPSLSRGRQLSAFCRNWSNSVSFYRGRASRFNCCSVRYDYSVIGLGFPLNCISLL